MTDTTDDESTQTEPRREFGYDLSVLNAVLGHAYRGELARETTWCSRLDQTTTWSVTVMPRSSRGRSRAPTTPTTSSSLGCGRLLIEARRYRDYDVYRARVRLLQQNFLATTLDPSQRDEHSDWRTDLSDDYRRPTLKITLLEAISNRLRRIYFALLTVLCLAWLFRVTAFAPGENFPDTAAIASAPGAVVAGVVGTFYVGVLVLAFWPREREAKEEFRETEAGDWKESE
ncbi:DUF2270 domain-containing protein [Natronorubrum aibiense]|uniref:DUF2270 domain-containing protein n=1 Tax=Natronorubrum aibiense TaxID=348826 RepID=A0A5P9P5B1_9EURY|nr:DUF2270 domain-containing protein [Natronorubrum aibiense]QFU83147.1 DUF2270 domain-containing protein [Natronorubrum aibiense]